jgi:radical SAM superfamily enzyme YgiQ (UPF0313 family)
MGATKLRVVLIKPSKYGEDGYLDRYQRGYMPNATLPYIKSMTPTEVNGIPIEVHAVDEYVRGDLDYLNLLHRDESDRRTLLALVGVQSHQFHRALDLAAYAKQHGALAIAGGPHPMTCSTEAHQGRGLSFAVSEGEMVWGQILEDAIEGELRDVYGGDQRWADEIAAPVLIPPTKQELSHYASRLLGVYPARGCPYRCSFCSVIKIAGRQVRSQSTETTMATLRAAEKAGISQIFFTSDNFNKYTQAWELMQAMIDEKMDLTFQVQCDTQVAKQGDFIELMGRAGCHGMFLGVESLDRETLKAANKQQNHPKLYQQIVDMCRESGITALFSNIIGFPQDTHESIMEHQAQLCEINPDIALYYILTPIPGTEQYDEYMELGLITEPNLDRYDACCVTWRHPNLRPEELNERLYWSYLDFYDPDKVAVRQSLWQREHKGVNESRPRSVSNNLLSRFMADSARLGVHPMAGGMKRLKRDCAQDFMQLRRETFDCEFAPLPKSLALSDHDEQINREAKVVLPAPV